MGNLHDPQGIRAGSAMRAEPRPIPPHGDRARLGEARARAQPRGRGNGTSIGTRRR